MSYGKQRLMQETQSSYTTIRQRLLALFEEAVTAISPDSVMPDVLPHSPRGRTLIIAVGKAAAPMAQIAATRVTGDVSGLALLPYGHGIKNKFLSPTIEFVEASHPIPDEAGMMAAKRAVEMCRELTANDQLLMLTSGGTSALLALPAPGIQLAEKQEVTKSLLACGATISEINCVRKHLSAIKGGRLATAAAPASVSTYIISDIPGDDPSFVGSGPTIADKTTLVQAREIISRYGIKTSTAITDALNNPANETPSSDALGLAGSEIHIVARARDALAAADRKAKTWGYTVTDLGDHLQAEARYLGAGHAALARRLSAGQERQVIISGGETTVSVTNKEGRGGRNLEYLLSLAINLKGASGVSAIACDTDGIDGTEDNAGGIITPDTLERAHALGLEPNSYLATNNAYSFFDQLGDLVMTGPTRTNTNDFRAIIIDPTLP